MMRLIAFVGVAVVLFPTPLKGQAPSSKSPRPTAKISQKDRAADDDRSRGDRQLIGMIVRLVPSSNVAWRSSVLGRQVQAEGVAFGGRVLMDSCDIKVEGDRFDLVDDKYNGRLVRVTGVLRYSHGLTSRFGNLAPYFYIEPDSCEVMERVSWPSLTTQDNADIPVIELAKPSSGRK